MVVRKVTKDDIEKIINLFKSHDPENTSIELCSGTGILCEEDGEVLGCAFLFLTNSPICMLDMFCVDKFVDKDKRTEIIDSLLDQVKVSVKDYGYKHIVCAPIYRRSEARLLDHGFVSHNKNYWYEVK